MGGLSFETLPEHLENRNVYPGNKLSWTVSFVNLVEYLLYYPFVLVKLYGMVLGVLLFPFHLLFALIVVIFKVLLLNPPFTEPFQSTIDVELISPMCGAKSLKDFYSLGHETNKSTRSFFGYYGKHTWWEAVYIASWFRFPLVSGAYTTSDDFKRYDVMFTRTCTHPFYGYVWVTMNEEKNELVLRGTFRVWAPMKPLFAWLLKLAFEMVLYDRTNYALSLGEKLIISEKIPNV